VWSWDETYANLGWAGLNREGVGEAPGVNQRVNLEVAEISEIAVIARGQKTQDLYHRGHEGTQRQIGEIYPKLAD
jgi:hypothetical protein